MNLTHVFLSFLNFLIIFWRGTNGKKSKFAERIYRFNVGQKRTVIETHNRLRAQEPAEFMQELVWDENLADLAADWAGRCMALHRTGMERSRTKTSYKFVGENMWWSTEKHLRGMDRVIQDFYSEKKDYTYATRECKRGKLCGHYTAVVWDKTCAVGCAAAKCSKILFGMNIKSGTMIVCNYGPGGNRLAQWPYKLSTITEKCSQCPDTCSAQGLCPSQCTGPGVKRISINRNPSVENPAARRRSNFESALPKLNSKAGKPVSIPLNFQPMSTASNALTALCQDSNRSCWFWSVTGECSRNPAYMRLSCRKSCSACNS